jgi:hypothetical protein
MVDGALGALPLDLEHVTGHRGVEGDAEVPVYAQRLELTGGHEDRRLGLEASGTPARPLLAELMAVAPHLDAAVA